MYKYGVCKTTGTVRNHRGESAAPTKGCNCKRCLFLKQKNRRVRAKKRGRVYVIQEKAKFRLPACKKTGEKKWSGSKDCFCLRCRWVRQYRYLERWKRWGREPPKYKKIFSREELFPDMREISREELDL